MLSNLSYGRCLMGDEEFSFFLEYLFVFRTSIREVGVGTVDFYGLLSGSLR